MSDTADLIAAGMHPAEATSVDRDDAIQLIRAALKKRSGKTWSVKGDRGTAWGWIQISSPPARRVGHVCRPDGSYDEVAPDADHGAWYMSDADRAELAALLGLSYVSGDGVSIAADSSYRREYIARARGLDPISYGVQYWD